MQADQKPVIWTVVIASIVLLVAGIFAVASVNSSIALNTQVLSNIEFPTAAAIAGLITIPEIVQPEFPDYMLSEDEYEENLMEAEAEKLALAELDSKEFRERLLGLINAEILANGNDIEQENLEIESYKDIEDVYSVDVEDVAIFGVNKARVEINFKVKYVLDDDEDLVGKARVTITYKVIELDVDDEFEDAEVKENFTLNDIYLYENLI